MGKFIVMSDSMDRVFQIFIVTSEVISIGSLYTKRNHPPGEEDYNTLYTPQILSRFAAHGIE